MRLRNIPSADDTIAESQYCIQTPESFRGSWQSVFQNDHPLHIEIGMGKGHFILQLAQQNPDIKCPVTCCTKNGLFDRASCKPAFYLHECRKSPGSICRKRNIQNLS